MQTQIVLKIQTDSDTVTSMVFSWDIKDSNKIPQEAVNITSMEVLKYVDDKYPIEYQTVIQALADGWKLLGPPRWNQDVLCYDWWLVK